MKPNNPIRRFDVFAEYQRLKAMDIEKLAEDEAKGYAIWLAKVVAARKFQKIRQKEGSEKVKAQKKNKEEREEQDLIDNKWHALDGVAQTDVLFEKEIVQRMGAEFYNEVFSPAVKHAVAAGEDYTVIRDKIRADWKTK